jgi:translational activator of cytochrome c oxidase 1
MQKQKTAADITRRIRNAVREGGNTNPKLNSALAKVLEDGKARDVSNTTMLDALKRLEKAKDIKGSQLFVEAKGIGNCMLIVETYTDRPKWTRQLVQHVMKRYGGTIGESGTSMHSFQFKGVVYVPAGADCSLSKDDALDAAIEAGAEEVHDGFDDGDRPMYLFICETKQLHTVKKALEAKGIQCSAARLEFLPHSLVHLDPESLDQAAEMLDELVALEDVVRVFDNIDFSGPGDSNLNK